ncbi:MAG: class I SAM-dependent rRNA methyltransferase [Pirellulales bacterium]|nr:class I SAM-dependent rRNA methyltransferase [Pirellulales bacterium]
MSTTANVVVKPHKAGPFFGRHPWVLDTAIARVQCSPDDGAEVELLSDKGQWIARGLFNSRSRIRVRLYSWTAGQALDVAFWSTRLQAALDLRRQLAYDDPDGAARLVFSESDGLSGLVVDRFAGHLVVQPTALVMAKRLDEIVPILVDMLRPTGVTVRTEPATAKLEGMELESRQFCGKPPEDVEFITEHGIRYGVQMLGGQKTGFYLDQRENRRSAAHYVRGRRVLDVCCYSGAFSLAASVLGGAKEVIGLDASKSAVALAQANAQLNGVTNVRFETGDCFRSLQERVERGERFGAVVLDPPKFVRGRRGVAEALRAYHRLNHLAVDLLEPGGILVTCSCSGSVTREDFASMLFGVAVKSRREIQILEQRSAAPDHPVSVTCPENQYLKCFICRVV